MCHSTVVHVAAQLGRFQSTALVVRCILLYVYKGAKEKREKISYNSLCWTVYIHIYVYMYGIPCLFEYLFRISGNSLLRTSLLIDQMKRDLSNRGGAATLISYRRYEKKS